MKIHKSFIVLAVFLSLFIVSFIVIPIIKIFVSLNPEAIRLTIADKEVIRSITITLMASFYATLFGVIFGVPLAYILARYNFRGKEILEGIIDIPVIIPHSAAGIALLGVFGKKFFIGELFDKIGIHFIGTQMGIAIAMAFVSVPFLINGAKEGFKLVNPKFENVAMTLGANKYRAFFDITLPLASRSIFSGIIMMWARGISEFGAVAILAYHPMVTSILVFERFESYGLKYAKPVAALLILLCLTIFIILRILTRRNKINA